MRSSMFLAAASTAVVLTASISTVALAWHPEGKITKEVSNVTLNSAYADANDASTAITARPGDTLRYRMTVINPADPAEQQYHDLAFIKVTDTLPTDVTLTSGTKDKDFGSIVVVPQNTKNNNVKSVSYDFTVKVSDTAKDGSLICNTAAFTGNSITKDAPRSGEDKACVKVSVPPTPVTPVTPDTPTTPETPATPATPATPVTSETPVTPIAPLPSTGPSTLLSAIMIPVLSALAFGTVTKLQRR